MVSNNILLLLQRVAPQSYVSGTYVIFDATGRWERNTAICCHRCAHVGLHRCCSVTHCFINASKLRNFRCHKFFSVFPDLWKRTMLELLLLVINACSDKDIFMIRRTPATSQAVTKILPDSCCT